MLNEQQILKETLEDKKIEAGKLPSKDLDDIIEDLSCRISTLTKDMSRYLILGLAKTLKNPAAAQNLIKVQEERIDLQKLFSRIIDELEDGRFDSLVEAVREGRKDSVALEDILKKYLFD